MANIKEKQHIPVFISSTYGDLIPYRDEVQRVLVRLEHIIKGMEYFGSNTQNPLDVCLKNVRESKVFIAIVGMRYGSIHEDYNLSYSQLEYEEAIKYGIPTLIYIVDENQPIAPKYIDFGEKAERLSEFKNILKKKHTVSFFTTPFNLGEKISHDLVETLSSIERIEVKLDNIDKNNTNGYFLYHKFLKRPLKYDGQEVTLTMSFKNKKLSLVKASLCKALGLKVGDTVFTDVQVLSDIDSSLSQAEEDDIIGLFADGDQADFLEELSTNDIIKAKVKFAYCTLTETDKYDGGYILHDYIYKRLILLELTSEANHST